MCDLTIEHHDMLKNLLSAATIPDSVYCDKLINLVIGGKWGADGPSNLQRMIYHVMSLKTDMMFERISKQTPGFQLRFWQFYWSSLQAHEELIKKYEQLKAKMIRKRPKEVKIMGVAFEYAWKEMDFPYDDYPHMRLRSQWLNVK